jgi:hypothetical protein
MRRLWVYGLAALLLWGCMSERVRQDALQPVLYRYGQVVRWGHMPSAYGMLKPDPASPVKVPEDLQRYRVTGYDVVSPPVQFSEDRVGQTAEIRYVAVDRQVEKVLIDQQVWEWDETLKTWLRVNPIPAFR